MLRQSGQIIHNYEIGVILPFDKNSFLLDSLTGSIDYFIKNGVEVILIAHENEEEAALKITSKHLNVNWKVVIVSETAINFSCIINTALDYTEGKYLFIMDSDLYLLSDCLYQLRDRINFYPGYFLAPAMRNPPVMLDASNKTIHSIFSLGPLFLLKEDLMAINGFDTAISETQIAKLNVQARLQRLGYRLMELPEAICAYRNTPFSLSIESLKEWYFNFRSSPDTKVIGHSKLAYNWKQKPDLIGNLKEYLGTFKEFHVQSNDILKKQYKSILLVQCYNEKIHVANFFENMRKHFDGIIFLDDDSSDNSYDLAQDEKLLIKVKKSRNGFNDLANRNILLQIASYINVEWLCFMDLDERFDPRFCDFTEFIDRQDIKTVIFSFVHIWQGDDLYNASLHESDNGFIVRYRMFRNIGRMQITSGTRLHFASVPYFDEKYFSKILFTHLGNSSKELRQKKYDFYCKEDNERDMKTYESLIDDKNIQLLPVTGIIYKNSRFENEYR